MGEFCLLGLSCTRCLLQLKGRLLRLPPILQAWATPGSLYKRLSRRSCLLPPHAWLPRGTFPGLGETL